MAACSRQWQLPLDGALAVNATNLPRMSFLRRALGLPVLAAAFVGLTARALGPLQPVDRALQDSWSDERTPYATDLFMVLDNVAGQAVALPVLALTALWLAVRGRTWSPVRLVVLVEAAFFGGVGLLKVLLARGSTAMGDPRFFVGQLEGTGWEGIAYPSGHAAEAVLLYGAVVHLLCTHLSPGRATRIVLHLGWAGVMLLATGVSFWLGFHWTTDLVAGLLVGGMLLHLVLLAHRWWDDRAPRVLLPAQLDGRDEELTAGSDRTPAARA